MSVDEYAALERRLGARLKRVNGVWWRRIRPLFYRPLLSHETLSSAVQPPLSWPAAFQYALENKAEANSTLNFLVYRNLSDYSLSSLNRHRQKQIRKAYDVFQVRPVLNARELREEGYPTYLSFFRRTAYRYRSDRAERKAFEAWADTFLDFQQVLILAARISGRMVAVSIAYWVGQTLIYSTIFCETDALRNNVASLMLHELRSFAASQPGLAQILARPYQGGNSLDRFYLDRECEIARIPARLVATPFALSALKLLAPRQHALLVGDV